MDTTTRILIPLTDLTGRLGVTGAFVSSWIDRLGIKTETDWAGRLGISEPDARKLIAAVEASGREAAELHEAHARHLEDWGRRQRAAGEAAFSDYIQKALEQQRDKALPDGYAFYGGFDYLHQAVGAGVYSAANQAAAAAREAFADKNPRYQDLYEFEQRWRKGKIR
jgi:hypothetical protein